MKTFDFLTGKYGKYSWILALAFIFVPVLLVAFVPSVYNPLAQVLFSFMLFAASLWLGVSISTKEAEQRATSIWLASAESACRELLTMSETAKRLRRRQGAVCQFIDKIVPSNAPQQQESVKNLLSMRCGECAFDIATLQNHMDNIYANWSVFINSNCQS